MICVQRRDLGLGYHDTCGDCSWSIIVEAIRKHAKDRPADEAADLNQWADLLEGIGELSRTAGA
jgi:hypothetical protein